MGLGLNWAGFRIDARRHVPLQPRPSTAETLDEAIKTLYSQLMLPRMIEEKMMSQLRQGKIPWFSGMGKKPSLWRSGGIGFRRIHPAHAPQSGGVTTRHRRALFSQFQGKANGFTRDATFTLVLLSTTLG